MRERLAARLGELRDELQQGQKMLADLDARRQELEQTLLRITGAIQVLDELLAAPESAPAGDLAAPAGAAAPDDRPVEANASAANAQANA